MVAEVYAGIGAFKALFDMAKGLKDIHDTTVRNAAIIALQDQILSAKADQSALIERLHTSEKENAEMKKWHEDDKIRYQMEKLPPGVIVYTLRPDMAGGDPPHHICSTCYQRGKKSPLDSDEPRNGVYHLICNECGAKPEVGCYVQPQLRVNVSSRLSRTGRHGL